MKLESEVYLILYPEYSEPMSEDDSCGHSKLLRLLPCGGGHAFHVECVDKWLAMAGSVREN